MPAQTSTKNPAHKHYVSLMDADITARIQKGRSGFKQLHKFWRHTNISTAWKLKVFNTVFVPMLTYSMESAALTEKNLHRLDAFQAQCLRKILNHKATYYTTVLNPTATTYHNTDIIKEANTPTISQHIQKLQLKFLGHVLRGSQDDLHTQICFTAAWVYRGGLKGDGLRRGLPKQHWLEQSTKTAWRYLTDLSHPQVQYTTDPQPPFSHLTLHRIAGNRQYWRDLTWLPTCVT